MKKLLAYLVFALSVLLIPNSMVEANNEPSIEENTPVTVVSNSIPKHKYICLEELKDEDERQIEDEHSPVLYENINIGFGLLSEFAEETNEYLEEEIVVPSTVINSNTIYDVFTPAELELIFRVVEAETYGNHYEEHLHVANVIFNRLRGVGNSYWGKNITEVLTSPHQFMVVTNGFYKKVKISAETVKAVEDAWKCDYTNGSLFFDSTNGKSWAARNKTFVFRDGAGHDFYK